MSHRTPDLPAGIRSVRVVVGMEIHVELATRSKMFTRSANLAHPEFEDAEPNTLIDPVVVGLPGTLPVMNRAAVEMSMMVGLALGCEVAPYSKWDRKNYFYPDLPKGYQISQYDLPLCTDGALEIPLEDGGTKRIGIIRAHLEEDTGKLGHELPGGGHYEGSLVDYNRAGTPLLEIVTQPDLSSADEAVTFGRELRAICRALGVTEGVMQKGHMRFEPNVNLVIDTDDGREVRTPIVEVKNLNSFRAVRGAIEHERVRQLEAWRQDGIEMAPGRKSTRGWNDDREITVLQREKEEAHDYRYFPEPDLVPVVVSRAWRDEVAARVPELPLARRRRYRHEYELSAKDAAALVEEPRAVAFYETCIEALASAMPDLTPASRGSAVAKLLLNAGAKRANERGVLVDDLGIAPEQVAGIVALREANEIGSTAADDLFGILCDADGDARAAAEANGLLQVNDEGALDEWIEAAIAAQPQAAEDFAGGKDAAAGRLVGAVMKASKGQADAKAVQERLRNRLRA